MAVVSAEAYHMPLRASLTSLAHICVRTDYLARQITSLI